MKKIILLCFIFFPILLYSETDYNALFDNIKTDSKSNETTIDIQPKKEFRLTFLGDHSFYFHIPVTLDHLDFTGNIKSPKFNNNFGIELIYKELKIKSGFNLNLKLNESGNWEKIFSIYPNENYLQWTPWKFKIVTGFQKFSWGVADGINPTDNINPRDYTSGLLQEKLSILSGLLSFYPFNFFSLDVVYVPFEQKDIFPVDIAEQIPQELFNSQIFDIQETFKTLPALKVITKTKINEKKVYYNNFYYDPNYFLLGGKLNFRFTNIDFSFSYLYDYDQYWTPKIKLKKDVIENTPHKYEINTGYPPPYDKTYINIPEIILYRVDSIELVRDRIHRIGADIKGTIDRFGLWAEICYSLTTDYLLNSYKKRNHKFQWILGIDFNFGPNNDYYFNFQYAGEFIPMFDDKFYKDYKDGKPDEKKISDAEYMEEYYYRALVDNTGSYTEGLTQAWILNIKFNLLNNLLTPNMTLTYYLPLIYDYDKEKRYGSMLIKPELDIMPVDSFHIQIGAMLFLSWKEVDGNITNNFNDKIGRFFNDNNIYIAIKYKWGYDLEK